MALLKSRDFYDLDTHAREDYDPKRVKVLQGVVRPRELAERISGGAAHYYDNFVTEIERSEEELEKMAEGGLISPIEPYWDPVLKGDQEARVTFLKRLHALGLGGFRRRIKGKVGMFFCAKKDGMQRLVVDARAPNQQHRRPPSTRLGTGTALGMLDLSDDAARAAGADPVHTDYYAASLDLRDSFYQFSCRRLSSWFACPWPERADTWEVNEVYDEDTNTMVPVDPGEPLYFVFEGLPMGWSWALYFCEHAMELAISRAVPMDSRCLGGLSVDRTPAPGLGPGSPIASVYVDNGTLIGMTLKDTIWRTLAPGRSSRRSGSSSATSRSQRRSWRRWALSWTWTPVNFVPSQEESGASTRHSADSDI